MNAITGKTARIIFALPFLVFGIFHFINTTAMAGMVLPNWPLASILVYLSGAGLILAALSIIIDKYAKLATLLLAAELLLLIVTIHIPGLGNTQTAQMSMMGLLKDMSLMGGALVISGIVGNGKIRGAV
jgi:putative oxidoreductase